jgi:phosphoribosylformimino-5-aminoimidazole carboxamide ribotide isomerase
MQIIPALCIKDGKAADFRPDLPEMVFLDQDPYQIIETFGTHDIRRTHLVDIDGAQQKGINNTGLIGSLSNTCICNIEVGGGIRSVDYLKSLQYAGVDYFVLGSVVYEHPQFLEEVAALTHIPNDDIMIAVDLVDGQLTYHGYADPIPSGTIRQLIQRGIGHGFFRVLVTDINTSANGQGPVADHYAALVKEFPQVKFSAAGHIATFEDVERLKAVGVVEAVVGYDFYRDEASLKRLAAYNNQEAKK